MPVNPPQHPQTVIAQLNLLADLNSSKAARVRRQLVERTMGHPALSNHDRHAHAIALMEQLAPHSFQPSFFAQPSAPEVRAALGRHASTFDLIREQLGGRASVVTQILPPSMPTTLQASHRMCTDTALSIAGGVVNVSRCLPDATALPCVTTGNFTPAQWGQALPELRELSPLLRGSGARAKIVINCLVQIKSQEHRSKVVDYYRTVTALVAFPAATIDRMVQVIGELPPYLLEDFLRVASLGLDHRCFRGTHVESIDRMVLIGKHGGTLALQCMLQSLVAATLMFAGAHVIHEDRDNLLEAFPNVLSTNYPDLFNALRNLALDAEGNRDSAAEAAARIFALGEIHRADLLAAAKVALPSPTPLRRVSGILKALTLVPRSMRYSIARALREVLNPDWSQDELTGVVRSLTSLSKNQRSKLSTVVASNAPHFGQLDSSVVMLLATPDVITRAAGYNAFTAAAIYRAEPLEGSNMLDALVGMDKATLAAMEHLERYIDPKGLESFYLESFMACSATVSHFIRATARLTTRPTVLRDPYDLVSFLMQFNSGIVRELVCTHLANLGFDLTWRIDDLVPICGFLRQRSSPDRASFVRAAKRLLTSAIAPDERADVLLTMRHIHSLELDAFVHACQWGFMLHDFNPRPSYQDIEEMQGAFVVEGWRPDIHGFDDAQNAHRHDYEQGAKDSIIALRNMVPVLPLLSSTVAAIATHINDMEAAAPPDDILRAVKPGHTRTGFDDARHALQGGTDRYTNFALNQDVFDPNGVKMHVGDLLNHVWQAIENYPAFAMDNPMTPADIEKAKSDMRRNVVALLADCIDKDEEGIVHRVCYMGKTTRMIPVLQGFIEGIGFDGFGQEEVHLPDETLSPGSLLSSMMSRFQAGIPDPNLEDIDALVGEALAAAENQWPQRSAKRDAFTKQLREFVELTYDDILEGTNFWELDAFWGVAL